MGAPATQFPDGDSSHGDMEWLAGKEPELVREVERYRLEIVGLTTMHSLEPNSLREAGLSSTLELPVVRGGELVWAC